MNTIIARQTEAEVAQREPSSTSRRRRSTALPPLVVGAVLVVLAYIIHYLVLPPRRRFLLPAPHQIITEGMLSQRRWAEQFSSLWDTTQVAAVGLAIAAAIGFSLAIIMSQSTLLEHAIFPYGVMLQAMPILALAPLIGLWLKYGFTARATVCVLISVFPIMLNTLFGLQSADPGLHDLMTLHHASRWARLRRLMIPAALPAIFAGLRISAGLSVIGAIVGEFYFAAGTPGIGQDLKKYAANNQGAQLYAAIALTCGLGVAVFLGFGWLRTRTISKWYDVSSP